MKRYYHREKIIFRVVGFPPKLLPLLKQALPDVNWGTGYLKGTRKLVVCFTLEKKIHCKKLQTFLIKGKIPPSKCGLWISLVTERDSDGVHVPDFAVRLFQHIGGQLDFSFTFV